MLVPKSSYLTHWWPKRSNAILMYHSVGNKNGFGNIDVKRFKRDLDYIIEQGYEIVDIKRIMSGSKRMSLTFDDGLVSFYKNVYPILREYQIPATVFAIANTVVDGGEIGLRDSHNTMEKNQLKEINENELVRIGNHTKSHPNLVNLDLCSAYDEIVESKTILEDFLGEEVDVFCYPWGQYNKNIIELVQESHNMAVTTHGRKMSRDNNDIYRLPRIPGHSRRYILKWKLSGTSNWWDRVRQLLEAP